MYKDISIFNCALCFVVKVYYNFVPLSLFVELWRFIPIKAPVYKDISIFNCALDFVVKVYYNVVALTLFVELITFIHKSTSLQGY